MILTAKEQIREYTEKGWWGDKTLIDLFLANVQSTPDAIAVVDPPNRAVLTVGDPLRLTYAELKEATDRLACALLDLGVGKDDIVMVQLPNVVELICVYLAAARIGAILSPLPVQYRRHELRQVIGLTEPKVFITTTKFEGFDYVEMVRGLLPEYPSVGHVIALGGELPPDVISLEGILNTPCDESRVDDYVAENPSTANDIYTICWTSGTETDPKGVPRSHNLWIAIAYATVDGADLEPGYTLLNPFPMVNMSSIGGMLYPWMMTGGKLVMHHPLDLAVFLQQIGAEEVNYTVVPPVLLNLLLLRPSLLENADLSHIKNIGSGSAPLSPWMVSQWQERFGIGILNFFGSNEGIAFVSDTNDIPDPAQRARYFPRFGVPDLEWSNRVAGMISTKLVDPTTGEIVTEPGVVGEVAIKGATVFPGYYKRPDLTEKAFDEDGYFYTGDLFAIAGEGGELNRYQFVGRLKDLIFRGGMKVAPEEIEYLLADHPKVAEVSVVGVPSAGRLGEESVCAVVVPKPDEEVILSDLVDFLKEKDVAAYKLPRKLVIFDSLPRNAVGKVLKREIRRRLMEPGEEREPVPA
jgi:acyl-CoA synthetase (AMP-forming)/AMP-acid ligase II